MAEVYIKGLYHALEDLDRLTIDSAGILLSPNSYYYYGWKYRFTITQDDLNALKDRKKDKAENDITSMLKYLENLPETQSFAESTIASILDVLASDPDRMRNTWEYRIGLFAKAADKICRAAIPQDRKPSPVITSRTMSSILQRVEAVDDFIEKCDGILSSKATRTRASVELQDAL
jgi:hypothetical protein